MPWRRLLLSAENHEGRAERRANGAERLLLDAGDPVEQLIHPSGRYTLNCRGAMNKTFPQPNCQFDWARPLIPIPFLENFKTSFLEQRVQRAAPVPQVVVVDEVVIGPEALKRGNGYQQSSSGCEQRVRMPQSFAWIIHMLEDIEHQDERIGNWCLKMGVKRNDLNAIAVRTLKVHDSRIGFDALHIAEFREPVKKETIAAAHVQDAEPALRFHVPVQDFQNRLFPSTPPPMTRVEVAVLPRVFCFQRSSLEGFSVRRVRASHETSAMIPVPAFVRSGASPPNSLRLCS